MDEFEHVLLDRATANFLADWHADEEAEETYLEYIRAAPDAVERLEIWHDGERVHVGPEKINAVTAA